MRVGAALILLLLAGSADAGRTEYKVIAGKPGIDTSTWGTIEGICRISKVVEIPELESGCGKLKRKRPSPRIAFDPETRGLAGCVVWIREIKAGKAWSKEMAVGDVDRRAKLTFTDNGYEPHVQWFRTGTQLVLSNSSSCEEDNIHGFRGAFGGPTVFNLLLPKGATLEPGPTYFEKPGMIEVLSDLHEGFSAHLHVMTNPYCDGPTSTTGEWR